MNRRYTYDYIGSFDGMRLLHLETVEQNKILWLTKSK